MTAMQHGGSKVHLITGCGSAQPIKRRLDLQRARHARRGQPAHQTLTRHRAMATMASDQCGRRGQGSRRRAYVVLGCSPGLGKRLPAFAEWHHEEESEYACVCEQMYSKV